MKLARGPRLVGGTLLLAIVGVLIVAEQMMGAPPRDLELLALFLTASGVVSLSLGGLVIYWVGARVGSVRMRLVAACSVGLLIALANILMTSVLMFLNTHDLTLLVLLLAFAAVISIGFAYAIGDVLTRQLGVLSSVARRLASGDLSARVGAHGADDIGHLSATLDHMAAQLEAAFLRERSLEAGRRELISAVSHDLRTPLATTRAMVEALADGVVTDKDDVQQYLALILGETTHLSRLIDDLFELSQIESGALTLRSVPIDVGELVTETVAAYRAPAAEHAVALDDTASRDLTLRTPTTPTTSTRMQADPERLQRVLRNLLDNALRHTPSGGTIQVSAAADAEAIVLTVSDSGPGVPNVELERIFDRFYRSERSRHRDRSSAAGAGLGLAIARGLVQAHHGRIWAERSPLGGIAVHVSLPRVEADHPSRGGLAGVAGATPSSMRIRGSPPMKK